MTEIEEIPILPYPKSKRAIRRHHVNRLKTKRKFHFGMDFSNDPVAVSRLVRTPTPCSCWMCGNERKYFGKKTIQEQKHEQININKEMMLYYEDCVQKES